MSNLTKKLEYSHSNEPRLKPTKEHPDTVKKLVLIKILKLIQISDASEITRESIGKIDIKKLLKALNFTIIKKSEHKCEELLSQGWGERKKQLNITDIKHISDFEPESFYTSLYDRVINAIDELLRQRALLEFMGTDYQLPDNPTYYEIQMSEIKKRANKLAAILTQKTIQKYDGDRKNMPGICEKTRILHGNVFPGSDKYTIVIPGIHTTDEDFYKMFQSICHFAEQQDSNTIGINTFYTPNDKEKSYNHILKKIKAVIESIKEKNPNVRIVLASHSAGSILSVKLLEIFKDKVDITGLNFSPALDRNNTFSSSLTNMFTTVCGEAFDHMKYDKHGLTFLAKNDDVIFTIGWKNRSIEGDHSSCFQDERNERRFNAAFKLLFKEKKQ